MLFIALVVFRFLFKLFLFFLDIQSLKVWFRNYSFIDLWEDVQYLHYYAITITLFENALKMTIF